jgi:hypothetical protein
MPPSTVGSTTKGPAATSHPLLLTVVAMLSERLGVRAATDESPDSPDPVRSHPASSSTGAA